MKIFEIYLDDKYLIIHILGIRIAIKSKTQEKTHYLLNKYNALSAKYGYVNKIVSNTIYGESTLLQRIKKYDVSKTINYKIKSVFFINTVVKRVGASKIAYTMATETQKLGYKNSIYTSIHKKFSNEDDIKLITLCSYEEVF